MQHLVVLKKVEEKLKREDGVLAVLLFGSVASNTYHKESDIDLSVIYKEFEPNFEFSTGRTDGIKIGYSKWSLNELKRRAKTSPYRMYVFAHAKLLFDKSNEIKNIQKQLLDYFKNHPEVQKDWDMINDRYMQEKEKYGAGQTNIFDVYAQLDKKYSIDSSA